MAQVTNEFMTVITKIVGEFRELHERAAKSNAVPFGQEKVTARQFKERLVTMTPLQREALLKDPETRERVLQMIREGM